MCSPYLHPPHPAGRRSGGGGGGLVLLLLVHAGGGVLSLDDVEGPRCRCPGWRSSGAGWGRSRGRGGDTEEERVCGGEVRGVRGHGGGLAEVAGRVLERGALPVHLQLLPQDIFSNS